MRGAGPVTLTDPEAFLRGAALFNAGQWWEAHEAWEGPWSRAEGDERALLQALILLAAALHKCWHHGSRTHRNLYKADAYLARLPATCAGLDLRALRADVWLALHDPSRRPQVAVGAD
jgi:predicted metal-dependent hydrolase